MGDVRIHLLQANEEPPVGHEISAVFLVAFRGGRMLAVRNERGWDLPGGHVEPGEDLMIALRREVREEAGAMFNNATAYALLCTGGSQSTLVFIASYHGDKNDVRAVILAAKDAVRRGRS